MIEECALLPGVSPKDERRTIIRQEANAKVFAILFCLFTASANAIAQVESGTVILVGYSKNKVIMAADSRESHEGKAPSDDRCKITTLDNKFLFAATGRVFDRTRGIVGWDAVAQAKQAYTEASKQPRLVGHTLARDAADEWARLMRENISAHIRPQEFVSLRIRSLYVDGTFAGVDPAGTVQVARIVIGRNGDYPTIGSTLAQEPSISDSMQYMPLGGHSKEFTEVYLATTERSKTEKKITLKQSKTWKRRDADARMVIRLTELIIKYADDPEHVHGPVDAVEINKSGTLRWIQRKPNCKDQQQSH